jgi:hypothetical protein
MKIAALTNKYLNTVNEIFSVFKKFTARFGQNTVQELPIKTGLVTVSFVKSAARKLVFFINSLTCTRDFEAVRY